MPAGGVELVLHQALAAKGTVGFVLLGAAAGLGGLSGVTLANDLAVVVGDDVPKIGHIYIYIFMPTQGQVPHHQRGLPGGGGGDQSGRAGGGGEVRRLQKRLQSQVETS